MGGPRERNPVAKKSRHDVKELPATAKRTQGPVRGAEAARLGVGREFDFACGFDSVAEFPRASVS
jgi:hypothetical protein